MEFLQSVIKISLWSVDHSWHLAVVILGLFLAIFLFRQIPFFIFSSFSFIFSCLFTLLSFSYFHFISHTFIIFGYLHCLFFFLSKILLFRISQALLVDQVCKLRDDKTSIAYCVNACVIFSSKVLHFVCFFSPQTI